MDTKQAEKHFHLSSAQIYELGKKNLCGIHKVGRMWQIPDETKILIPYIEIRRFLFQILSYKNNPGYVFPRDLCPNDDMLKELINQQYLNGFVGEKAIGNSASEIINNIKITDKGINLLFGKDVARKLTVIGTFKVDINPTVNVGLINISL